MQAVSAAQLKRATRNDLLLNWVYRYVQRGWPDRIPESLKTYHNRKTELTLEGGCMLWGTWVVMPRKCCHVVLDMLREGQVHSTRLCVVAGLGQDLTTVVKECPPCQQVQK